MYTNLKALADGWSVKSQTPIDDRLVKADLFDLIDLTGHKQYTYYEGMPVFVLSTNKHYNWVESVLGEIPGGYTYPASIVAGGVNYSGRTFNFIESSDSLPPPLIIDMNWSALLIYKNASLLIPGQIYRIPDRYNYQSGGSGTVPNQTMLGDDRGTVYTQALTANTLNKEVIRIMACPSYYDTNTYGAFSWKGVWHSSKSVAVNELMIRGGRVWQKINTSLPITSAGNGYPIPGVFQNGVTGNHENILAVGTSITISGQTGLGNNNGTHIISVVSYDIGTGSTYFTSPTLNAFYGSPYGTVAYSIIGSATGDSALDNNWVLWSKQINSPNLYTEKQFSAIYDFDNDWFEEQSDNKGNVVGVGYMDAMTLTPTYNPCDITDWNFYGLRNNKCKLGVYNNTVLNKISNNNTKGGIFYNYINNSINGNTSKSISGNNSIDIISNNNVKDGIDSNDKIISIDGNTCLGGGIIGNIYRFSEYISNNNVYNGISNNVYSCPAPPPPSVGPYYYVGGIQNNNNITEISYNIDFYSIANNSNIYGQGIFNNSSFQFTGAIMYNSNVNGIFNCLISATNNLAIIGNKDYEGTITGGFESDVCAYNRTNKIIGVVLNQIDLSPIPAATFKFKNDTRIISGLSIESVTEILSFGYQEDSVIFKPQTGVVLTFVHGTAADQPRCEGGVNVILDGSNGDWVEFKLIGGIIYQVNIGTY